MARSALDNLETYQTPKERLHNVFWGVLRTLVVCYLSWDLSAYLLKFWETGNALRLISPTILAIALVYTLKLADIRRRRWLVIPAALALVAPVVLHVLGQPAQPNSRFLSDAYESALSRASPSAPKPER